ncbi:MAG: bifunctional UDP-N-acetylglucosamine diphosphorylase/glucosamine-1-phosphate N-acetyltransferase GlmU, partial [Sciscionella sp.]|nr:bifunctional UDP-N-acetylglucosamine diphosphorylase/glucosamine-1-phosphate N-acetyltransferase GlmU [Sciscionella sp.]
MTAIVLAAGEGTRMRSRTPKVLHQIGGRALVEHAVRAAAGAEPGRLAVVVGHARQAVTEHLDRLSDTLNRTITVAVQEKQLGTGHAVRCALDELAGSNVGADTADGTHTGTVLVSYGDVPLLDAPTLRALLAEHGERRNAVTMLTAVVADPSGYGRVLRADDGAVLGVVEHKDCDAEQLTITEINSGVYAFDAAILADALHRVTGDNAQGELYLPDVLAIARADGHPVGALVVDDPWLVEGVNDRVQLAALGAELNRRIIAGWQRTGVTVVDPTSTWIDCGVRLGNDALIEPGVQLRGATVIGSGATVGPDSTLTDTTVGDEAVVIRTHAIDAVVGDGATVGPFAYLRPGTKLGKRGKIGAFVETKNADIGAGSKVPHLTYVGDATIGEHSNIGCSSVFVNYDGVTKSRTTVGSHVKIGSDNTLVAPVRIGDGAYSGAGTVIREDVPPGALAVSAGKQRTIDGWVLDRRAGTPAAEAAEKALANSTADAVDAENTADAVGAKDTVE